MLRGAVVLLLSVLGVLDLVYGFFYAGGNYENIWYIIGAIYIVLAGVIVLEIEPLLFRPIVLGYSLLLFFAWLTSGVGRDPVAYADKVIEVVLAISALQLIRISHPTPAVSNPA